MKSIDSYYDGMDLFPAGTVKISPSGLGNFFSSTSQYYRETLLGEDGFTGNSGSITGTLVHYAAETGEVPTYEMVNEYLNLQTCEYDPQYILDNYIPMCEAIIAHIQDDTTSTIISKEQFIHTHIEDIVHVGGTYDALYTTTEITDMNGEVHTGNFTVLRDYKSAAKKPSYPFTNTYRTQLLAYVHMLAANGTKIDAIELKYIVAPTKTMGARIFTYTQMIDQSNLEYIKDILHLVAHSILAFIDYPHLRHIISQDGRLQNTPCKYQRLDQDEEI